MMTPTDGIFHSKALSTVPDTIHGYSSRQHGDMRTPQAKAAFLHIVSPHNGLATAQQVHGSDVARVSVTDVGKKIPLVDGLVTDEPIMLGVISADCVPLLFADPTHHVYGAAHAGWKGTIGEIAIHMIREMTRLGSNVHDIHVVVGPHICRNCYSVSSERAHIFTSRFGDDMNIVKEIDGTWHVDIGQANIRLLAEAGIPLDYIDSDFPCTSCHNDIVFSYRKDANTSYGEIIGMIGRRI
jgi:polyphenol oxidase